MFDYCFIIPVIDDKNMTQNITNIANKLGIKNIITFNIDSITKEQLIENGDISKDVNTDDLNNIVHFLDEKRFLSETEIKNYVVHKMSWITMQKHNMDNVLVLENDITIKEEFTENFGEKIKKVKENACPLFSLISLFDSNMQNNNKYNEYFNYPNKTEHIQKAYVISKLGIKKLLTGYPLSPIRAPIHAIIHSYRIFKKDLFRMKFPIFERTKETISENKDYKNMILSLPTKKIIKPIKKVFILRKNKIENNFLKQVHFFTNMLGLSSYVLNTEQEIWEQVLNEQENGVLIIKNSVTFVTEDFIRCLNDISNNLPINYKFIGLPSKENNIKHPFRFSEYLEFIHPEMSNFSCYLLSKEGAKMLLENNNANISFLAKEHYCFAYRKKIIIETDDF